MRHWPGVQAPGEQAVWTWPSHGTSLSLNFATGNKSTYENNTTFQHYSIMRHIWDCLCKLFVHCNTWVWILTLPLSCTVVLDKLPNPIKPYFLQLKMRISIQCLQTDCYRVGAQKMLVAVITIIFTKSLWMYLV